MTIVLTKLLVVELDGFPFVSMLETNLLSYFPQLMQVGCFGEFEANAEDVHIVLRAVGERLAALGKQTFLVDTLLPQAQLQEGTPSDAKAFSTAFEILRNKEWDFVHVSAHATGMSENLYSLDAGLGGLLECLNDASAILVLTNREGRGGFILGVPNNSIQGQVPAVRFLDLLSTLSELTTLDIPDWMQGKSLVKISLPQDGPASAYSQEDEAAVYARLEGLGYIG